MTKRPRLAQPPLDNLLLVGGTAVETAGEFLKRGRDDKNEYRVGALGPDLGRPLHLDIQQHINSGIQLFPDYLQRSTVIIMDIFCVFQQLFVGNHPLKGRPIHKVIVDPVRLAHPGLPGGKGHGKIDVLPLAQKL